MLATFAKTIIFINVSYEDVKFIDDNRLIIRRKYFFIEIFNICEFV